MTDHDIFASEGQKEHHLCIDKDFLKATKTVLPFINFHGLIPEMEREAEKVVTGPRDDSKNDKQQRDDAVRGHIYKNWKTNPVKFDPVWHAYSHRQYNDVTKP